MAEFVIFEETGESGIEEVHDLERELSRALVNNEFVVHYQPILDVRTKKVVYF